MQDQQKQDIPHKKFSKKRVQQLSTIIENGESYMASPHPKSYGLQEIDSTPSSRIDTLKQDNDNQQQRANQINKQRFNSVKKKISRFSDKIEEESVQSQTDKKEVQELPAKEHEIDKEKTNIKSNQANSQTKKKQQKRKESNCSSENQKKSESQKKSEKIIFSAKEDEMIKNIKISLTNIPIDIDLESQKENKPEAIIINEYDTTLNILKFFLDKKIRLQEKLLFFVSVSLIIADMGASIHGFYLFASTSCFGHESDMEFSDVINIIFSVILKFCCINIIMQEITNSLPGNMKLPYLIPLCIMGVVPCLQLNQFVFSFTQCKQLNPIISYGVAKQITNVLCYIFISIIGMICILIMIIRIEITRQTWKRLKNIGFYVLVGGFLLSMIFIFIFASVVQSNQQFVLFLCLDNITFWVFFFICSFYSVRKLYYKLEPFPYQPQFSQQVNSQVQLYAHEEELESQRLTQESKQKKSLPNKIKKKKVFKEDQINILPIINNQQKQQQDQQQAQNILQKLKKKKKKIMFSPQNNIDLESQQKTQQFSFHSILKQEQHQGSADSVDSQSKMVSSLEKSPVKQQDDQSQPEFHQDDATTSSVSNVGRPKKLSKFRKNNTQNPPSVGFLIADEQNIDENSLPCSKTSFHKKDNLSNTSKSSLKDEQFAASQNNSQKSFGIIVNQDQSQRQHKSLNEFQKKDMELSQLNKQLTPNSNNHFYYPDSYGGQSKDTDQISDMPRVRSLNKLDEDQELAENQIRKNSLPKYENTKKTHFEVQKKSLFDNHLIKQNN
ncbi:transmembrane protein, putative (macronuclear) [Tetrahymena thermophila SB210]|uniref:Transmembrane protein, putative n=1 Tax=Tetrahymena thermophila (strain SB210) TaxID=312017 RepID=Q23RK0_TETTS|nr:transmembrane protein, putative [Tetrahymena thermophila SB210]EAR99048.2 transmembrane protein, putative [Tetrahymena thermophila SB210]|eukprot:XP_001019293.2 transmembrane protein, putative [Tetrahymena thermophila SB210]